VLATNKFLLTSAKHPEVLTWLQHLQAKLQFHAWPMNVWDVVSVGFLTGAIPWYSLPSQIQDQATTAIQWMHKNASKTRLTTPHS
jgi:hypothetical protein